MPIIITSRAQKEAAAEAERAAAAAARGRKAVANALAKHIGGGRRTRKSRGLMASVKKFFGMTRSRRGRSRRQ